MATRTAALYLRMSTEKQDYSISHQKAALEAYARARKIEIVRVYQDEGKSGLEIRNRTGLLSLLEDVQSMSAGFDTILVYDISRWGRFQDADESAHYEYVCRRAGVKVEYCAELFTNDDSPIASLLKSIKRTMAAEYSRDLSDKVFYAQCRFARKGYKQGGSAGYGLRRMLVSADGKEKGTLKAGQRKGFASDRVVFVLGPSEEVAVVRRIYRLYLKGKLTQTDIAARLNAERIPTESGRPWNLWSIKNILTNEKYIGTLVFNRKSTKLRQKSTRNPSERWIRLENAFEPIVSRRVFEAAQAERVRRNAVWTPDELLAGLQAIHAKHGAVNAKLLADGGMPNPKIFIKHFGSLAQAYVLAGLPFTRYVVCGLTKVAITVQRERALQRLVELIPLAGGTVASDPAAGVLLVNGTIRLKVVVLRCHSDWSRPHWRLPCGRGDADFTLYGLLDEQNVYTAEYFLLSSEAHSPCQFIVRPGQIPPHLEQFRFRSLTSLFGLDGS